MKILLLNENSVVSKLISLSAKKMSYDFEELDAYDENLGHYDVIVVDSDTPAPLKILQEKCDKLIFLAPRNQTIDIDAQVLYKPFLPTDFLNLLNGENLKIDDTITTLPIEDTTDNLNNDNSNAQDLSLKDVSDNQIDSELNEDDLSLDEELEIPSLDSEEEVKNDENIDDVNLDINFEDEESKNENLDTLESDNQKDTDNSNSEIEESNIQEQEFEESKQIEQEDQGELEINEESVVEENNDINQINEEEITKDELPGENSSEILEEQNEEILQENEILDDKNIEQADVNKTLDEELPIVEEQEKEVDFNDIPQDAEFLGETKEENQELEQDFLPIVESEEESSLGEDNDFGNLSTQDQIKEELEQLDELEHEIDENDSPQILEDFKDEPVFDTKDLQVDEEEVVIPNLSVSEFDSLKESEIQRALGEEVTTETIEEPEEEIESLEELSTKVSANKDVSEEEIVNELSQSIAGAITSSIKDDTLKAALKGMNMNININVSFNEE
ncbi:hypothetical protein [Campylobacter estrildidarum]|uniref:Highly acidic protein n=1 Tax=Campylobacter estrildidarum TaxID=2510189 RepID=A0A4U7BJF8_9BACT|nr:hypothetical protein [Campylobacter estrildidarum]TKX32098.1 hypothetical protein CQA69_00900 [Campylobacter estrildidarum]